MACANNLEPVEHHLAAPGGSANVAHGPEAAGEGSSSSPPAALSSRRAAGEADPDLEDRGTGNRRGSSIVPHEVGSSTPTRGRDHFSGRRPPAPLGVRARGQKPVKVPQVNSPMRVAAGGEDERRAPARPGRSQGQGTAARRESPDNREAVPPCKSARRCQVGEGDLRKRKRKYFLNRPQPARGGEASAAKRSLKSIQVLRCGGTNSARTTSPPSSACAGCAAGSAPPPTAGARAVRASRGGVAAPRGGWPERRGTAVRGAPPAGRSAIRKAARERGGAASKAADSLVISTVRRQTCHLRAGAGIAPSSSDAAEPAPHQHQERSSQDTIGGSGGSTRRQQRSGNSTKIPAVSVNKWLVRTLRRTALAQPRAPGPKPSNYSPNRAALSALAGPKPVNGRGRGEK